MPSRETGRERSQRIELDYYRQRGGLAKAKVAGALLGLGAGVALAWLALKSPASANPGRLSEGHVALEKDCAACHRPFTPIGRDAVREVAFLDIEYADSVEHTLAACTTCHENAEQPIGGHYRDVMHDSFALTDKNCAVCHSEHGGRRVDLTQVSDQQCTECHAQLEEVCLPGKQSVQLSEDNRRITAFSSAHGDFDSLRQGDSGKVKFDHAQHLSLGQAVHGKEAMRLGDVEPEVRESYRMAMERLNRADPTLKLDTSDQGLVQLDCGSCHQLAGAPEGDPLSADAELGRYMQPIVFEDHCGGCHAMNPSGRTEGTLPIPHAAPWSELEQWLSAKEGKNLKQRTRSNPTGIGVVDDATADRAAPDDTTWELATMEQARRLLENQCLKCHDSDLIRDDASIMAARSLEAAPLIPQRWLRNGIYDHASHIDIDCRHCHQQAFDEGTPDQPGNDHNQVMIAGIDSCVGCHRPPGTPTPVDLLVDGQPDPRFGGLSLWASDDCTVCHRYHSPEAPAAFGRPVARGESRNSGFELHPFRSAAAIGGR